VRRARVARGFILYQLFDNRQKQQGRIVAHLFILYQLFDNHQKQQGRNNAPLHLTCVMIRNRI